MVDKEAKNLNGVVITIPDHNHAQATFGLWNEASVFIVKSH